MLKKILSNKYIKIPLIIVCFIVITCFSFFQIRRLIVINYLNNRYGDGDWKIVACKDVYISTGGWLYSKDEKFYKLIFSKNVTDADVERFIYYSIDESERNNTFLTESDFAQREPYE